MSLTAANARRLGGVAGILFVVVAIVALFLPGTPPKANEVAKIGAYLATARGRILTSDFLIGIAFALFLLFAGTLRSYLGEGDRTGLRPGATALAGAVSFATLVMAGGAVENGAVFQATTLRDANLTDALYFVANDLLTISGFGLAVFFAGAAAAIGVSKRLPASLAPLALVLSLLNVISGVALFASSGFFAIGGAFGYIVPLASLLWVLAVSAVMVRGKAQVAGAGASETMQTRPAD